MQIVFIMDPPERVLVDKDTSFALMLEAQARGHRVFYADQADVWLDRERVLASVREARVRRAAPPEHVALNEPETVDLRDLDAVMVRTDPPFDARYLYTTLVLERLRGRTLVVNDPRGLRDANEKLYATHFQSVTPKTLIAQHAGTIRAFVREMGGRAVIKPLDGAGGRGVFVLTEGDLNFNAIIDGATHDGRRLVVVQEFLPAVRQGDKRVLLLDGEPLGAINRVPRADEARSNIHVGGTVEPAEITPEDAKVIEAVAPRLRADGLWFVGLDVIGGRLTEVNVTSPTGIQELARFTGDKPEARVIAWVERRAETVKKGG